MLREAPQYRLTYIVDCEHSDDNSRTQLQYLYRFADRSADGATQSHNGPYADPSWKSVDRDQTLFSRARRIRTLFCGILLRRAGTMIDRFPKKMIPWARLCKRYVLETTLSDECATMDAGEHLTLFVYV